MTREDFDYERHEREMERAEEIAWDRDHEPDPFGWQADREQARWERQMSEREAS